MGLDAEKYSSDIGKRNNNQRVSCVKKSKGKG